MLAEQLYREIARLAPSVDPKAALLLGEEHWSEIVAREANPHDAESCRLLSLAASTKEPPDFQLAGRWRERALDLFRHTGWHEGVASVLIAKSFIALARANDDYARGRTLDVIDGSEGAVELMDAILPFLEKDPSGIAVGALSPSKPVLGRFYHEKRGFFLLALGRLDESRESYERAAEAAVGSVRGTVKVKLGAALVEYLAGFRDAALTSTRAAVAQARELGPQLEDLLVCGEHNVVVMERYGRDLRPYEIL